MAKLKLACINIERSKHLTRVKKFIAAKKPDILCLQEVMKRDLPFLTKLMGGKALFAPMTRYPTSKGPKVLGVAIITRGKFPPQKPSREYYVGKAGTIPIATLARRQSSKGKRQLIALPGSINCVLLSATIAGLRVATTHLSVTIAGRSTPQQRRQAARLIKLARAQAKTHGHLVLCGDFNAPRGRATFAMLASAFTDAIPSRYTNSLDPTLHRRGKEVAYMVDGLFHTPGLKARQVVFHTGVSDHKAITSILSL